MTKTEFNDLLRKVTAELADAERQLALLLSDGEQQTFVRDSVGYKIDLMPDLIAEMERRVRSRKDFLAQLKAASNAPRFNSPPPGP